MGVVLVLVGRGVGVGGLSTTLPVSVWWRVGLVVERERGGLMVCVA